MEIRRAHPDDADRLTAIALAAKGHWGYSEELMTLWRPELVVTPQRIAEDLIYVAVLAEQIVGFYSIVPTEETACYEVAALWIEPTWIGQGVGKQLFQHAMAQAKACGATRLQLAADPHAAGFYVKMGMRKIGEWPSQPVGRVLDLMGLGLVESQSQSPV